MLSIRTPIAAASAAASALLLASGAAHAAEFNALQLLNQAEFRALSEDVAAAISYKPMIPSEGSCSRLGASSTRCLDFSTRASQIEATFKNEIAGLNSIVWFANALAIKAIKTTANFRTFVINCSK